MSVDYEAIIAAGWRVEANKAILYPELEDYFISEGDYSDYMIAGVSVLRNSNPGSSISFGGLEITSEDVKSLNKIAKAFDFPLDSAKTYLVNRIC